MDIILAIATIFGGIAAIWFFWEQYRDNAAADQVEFEINETYSLNWSKNAFLSFDIVNHSNRTVILSHISIEVIKAKKILKMKDVMAGAPVIPIKGKVEVKPKSGVYTVKFENGINRIKLSSQDMEEILLEIDFLEGYVYDFQISAQFSSIIPLSSKKLIKSKLISYESRISSADKVLAALENNDENIQNSI